MQLVCNPEVATHLTSNSKRAGFITECWFAGFAYCLACKSDRLEQTKANTPARDYLCPVCGTPYELKAGAKPIGQRIVDGAYKTMMERIQDAEAPNLMVLRYTPEWQIRDMIALHSVFLTPIVIEKRPPLAVTARRAGWVGCNLRLDRIPVDGRIPLVRDGVVMAKAAARKLYAKSENLTELKPVQRGWAALVLNAVRKIAKEEFTLADVYGYEEEMHAAYPENSHVRDKIRQQLQILRNAGYLEFLSMRGEYRVLL